MAEEEVEAWEQGKAGRFDGVQTRTAPITDTGGDSDRGLG